MAIPNGENVSNEFQSLLEEAVASIAEIETTGYVDPQGTDGVKKRATLPQQIAQQKLINANNESKLNSLILELKQVIPLGDYVIPDFVEEPMPDEIRKVKRKARKNSRDMQARLASARDSYKKYYARCAFQLKNLQRRNIFYLEEIDNVEMQLHFYTPYFT